MVGGNLISDARAGRDIATLQLQPPKYIMRRELNLAAGVVRSRKALIPHRRVLSPVIIRAELVMTSTVLRIICLSKCYRDATMIEVSLVFGFVFEQAY